MKKLLLRRQQDYERHFFSGSRILWFFSFFFSPRWRFLDYFIIVVLLTQRCPLFVNLSNF